MYIEIDFTMRTCDDHDEPEHCKEAFTLLYYEADSDFANEMRPTWSTRVYNHIDVIAADSVWSEHQSDITINHETRYIPVTRNGVYFAFLDQGACVTLMAVRIYYIICPAVISEFAWFPNTTTATETATVVEVEGECVAHAVIEEQPRYHCSGNGEWQIMTGRCSCGPGYQPHVSGAGDECTRTYHLSWLAFLVFMTPAFV